MFIYYVLLFLSALIFASQFFVTRQYQMRNGTGFLGSVKLSFFRLFDDCGILLCEGLLDNGNVQFWIYLVYFCNYLIDCGCFFVLCVYGD